MSHSCLSTVSKYTREAGVRSLERKIGAICRAVAVKVAENVLPQTKMKGQDVKVKDNSNTKDKSKIEVTTDMVETIDVTHITAVQIPPQFPIIIDEQAVEDILGVCMHKHTHTHTHTSTVHSTKQKYFLLHLYVC